MLCVCGERQVAWEGTFVGRQNKQPEGTKCVLYLGEDEGLQPESGQHSDSDQTSRVGHQEGQSSQLHLAHGQAQYFPTFPEPSSLILEEK